MATPNKWKQKLAALDHAVVEHRDPHLSVIRSTSPSVNALFGNSGDPARGHGLPKGFSLLVGGPPKGGKSTLVNDMIGQFQRDYPNELVIKIDTEFKETAQTTARDQAKFGIDADRYICYEREDHEMIDFLTGDVQKMVQDGMPLGLLVLDCFNNIDGFRSSEAATAAKANSQIGDNARTCQMLMSKILPMLRRNRIGFIGTCHVGAEMDPLEQKRGHKMRMKTSYGTNHRIEYWAFVERDFTKVGKTDLLQREFVSETALRTGKAGDQVGVYAHKILVEMVGSSWGPVGREACFTYDYQRGIINQHEELFQLAKANGIITVGGGGNYTYGDKTWRGLPLVLGALEKEEQLRTSILHEIMRRDASDGYKPAAQ